MWQQLSTIRAGRQVLSRFVNAKEAKYLSTCRISGRFVRDYLYIVDGRRYVMTTATVKSALHAWRMSLEVARHAGGTGFRRHSGESRSFDS